MKSLNLLIMNFLTKRNPTISLNFLFESYYVTKELRSFFRFGMLKLAFLKQLELLAFILICFVLINGCTSPQSSDLVKIKEIDCHISEVERNEIIKIADYQMQFYQQIFNYSRYFKFEIVIFGDTLKYRNYQHKISDNARSSNGFYSSRLKKAVIFKNNRFLKTISHEMNHFILRSKLNPVPKWINEGLSEYYEMAKLEGNSVIIAPQKKKVDRIFVFMKRPDKLDIADFLKWENKKWSEVNKSGESYSSTLSWAIVYYIKSRIDGDDILKSILKNLKKGLTSTDVVQKHYPGGIRNLENDIINFYKQNFTN